MRGQGCAQFKEGKMIKVTRLNGSEFWINPHQIEFMEETPDTVIKMFSEKKVVVREKIPEVVEHIIKYRRGCGYMGNDTTF
jgi:flagellar protein FlbD